MASCITSEFGHYEMSKISLDKAEEKWIKKRMEQRWKN
jgi:hypothetical protein